MCSNHIAFLTVLIIFLFYCLFNYDHKSQHNILLFTITHIAFKITHGIQLQYDTVAITVPSMTLTQLMLYTLHTLYSNHIVFLHLSIITFFYFLLFIFLHKSKHIILIFTLTHTAFSNHSHLLVRMWNFGNFSLVSCPIFALIVFKSDCFALNVNQIHFLIFFWSMFVRSPSIIFSRFWSL